MHFLRRYKEGSHLFQGITDSTMVRGEGWHFIQLGRFIERALSVVALLDVQFRNARLELDYSLPLDEYIDWLAFLKSFTAFEAYCKVYTAELRADKIANFLLFNPVFPHSLRFCVEMINTALEAIAAETHVNRHSRLYRLIGRLRSTLSYDEMEDVAGDFHPYLENINAQLTQIHDGVYDTYIYRAVDAGL